MKWRIAEYEPRFRAARPLVKILDGDKHVAGYIERHHAELIVHCVTGHKKLRETLDGVLMSISQIDVGSPSSPSKEWIIPEEALEVIKAALSESKP